MKESTMAQHHFVVIYDDERNVWEYDSEQTGIAYPDGEIWEETEGEYFAAHHGATPKELNNANDQAAGDLAAMLALGSFVRSKVGA